MHIVVVGGGITGAFTAYHLARMGIDATLVERGEIGGEASGSNPGGLNPHHGPGIPGPMHELAQESFRLHLEAWPAISELSGIEFEARRPPRVHLAADEAEAANLRRAAAPYASASGFAAHWLERDEIASIEPRVGPGVVGGLLTEGNGKVDAASYVRAVAAAAARLGTRTLRSEAHGLTSRGGRVTEVRLDTGALHCDGAVIATGPWCAGPARWLDTAIPVEPLKGELLHVEPAGGSPAIDLAWSDGAIYVDGARRAWLGGTEERAAFARAPSTSARTSILERAERFLPGIAGARVLGQTAALRPVTPDGVPIVGVPEGWENVCLAVGSGRKGMLLGAGVGLAAPEIAAGGTARLPIGPCSPERWAAAGAGGAAR
jgi:glycine/D-amino acid oxidase-like deaminating enzyme